MADDILGLLLITRTLYFLNVYGIIRNSVNYIRVYIPYWHIIFTNESFVAPMVFKIFIVYKFTCIVTNLPILYTLQLLVNDALVNKVIVNKFNLFMKLERM